MKRSPSVQLNSKFVALLLAIGSIVGTTALNAQVYLTFGGGSGSEVTITWSSPIVYTLGSSTSVSAVNPTFVFQSVTGSQNIFSIQGPVGGVAPTYTSTGAGATDGTQTINTFFAATPSTAFNTVNADDVVFYATNDTALTYLTAGDVITLSAGSLRYDGSPTTSAGYSGALPADGYYNTFIADGPSTYASNLGSGSAVPEPSTYAALAGIAALGLAMWRRRRRVRAA